MFEKIFATKMIEPQATRSEGQCYSATGALLGNGLIQQ